MKILFATDGSSEAERAGSMVASLDWADGSAVRIISVAEPVPVVVSMPPTTYAIEQVGTREAEAALGAAAAALAAPGRTIETTVAHGRPATEIVREASRFNGDLIVMGSRGRGPVSSMLLGSVAAEVVDHAPCPVLVARSARIGRIVLADDGSPYARTAAELLASWPTFRGRPVRVVSVAHVMQALATGIQPSMRAAAYEAYAEAVAEARIEHERLANEVVEHLRSRGLVAYADVREGDPVESILDSAVEWGADLIAMGSRGRLGISRLVLGSVARGILTRSKTSVLIVRRGGEHGAASAE